MKNTKVIELMTKSLVLISPDATLKEAAEHMRDVECGVLPVGTAESLEGMITDRDIVIRAVAKGKDVEIEKVKNYMTEEVCACNEQDTLEQAAEKMCEHQVSRLIVRDKDNKVTGILSFGCMLRKNDNTEETSKVVECAIRKEAA